jgi:ABC-type histidine transport system ATPase subunit
MKNINENEVMLEETEQNDTEKAAQPTEKKSSVETVVALCNALAISPSVLLQDSLSDGALQSQLAIDGENLDLMRNIMHVLREHNRRTEYH